MSDSSAAVEVSPGIWLVKLPLPFPVGNINIYLIRGREGFLLLDCGMKTRACREALAAALDAAGAAWTDLRQIVISHLHPDHFGLAAEVRERSGAAICMHAAEAALLSPRFMDNDFFAKHSAWLAANGVPADESEEIAQASRGIQEFIDMFEVDRTLEDGDRLAVAGGELEVLWTPGHSPGLLTFYFAERKLYFSSDHILEKITPNIGLHTHSSPNPLGDYLASLERIKAREIDLVLPSHGHPFANHREWIRATEQHHRERCERMLAAVAGSPRTAYEVVSVEWGEHLSPLNERFAVAETLAHLEYLRRQAKVAAERNNGVVRWRKMA
ncbi:MAG TPA: MBL fold metallo-hydrolase [Bryobacterales bacterium]|nr:MBL fold metallo-hydrolase [Bryobacterales bacterium]